MKIFKYLLLLFLLFAIALTVFIATQPSSFEISASQTVKGNKKVVFGFVNDLNTWQKWFTPLQNTTTQNYSADSSAIEWNITEKLNIKKEQLVHYDSINCTINEYDFKGKTTFIFTKKNDTETIVTWRINGVSDNKLKFKAFLKGGFQSLFGGKMKQSLKNLNTVLHSTFFKYEISNDGFVTKTNATYIAITDTISFDGFDKAKEKNIATLTQIGKQHRLTFNNSPFVIFKTWNMATKTTIFKTCLPITPVNDSLTKIVNAQQLTGGLSLKTTLKGSYTYREEAWNTAFKAIEASNYKENKKGEYIEVYKTADAKIPANTTTEIYIPVYFETPKTVKNATTTNNDSIAAEPQVKIRRDTVKRNFSTTEIEAKIANDSL
ncbi:SRPBCC family protein [Flavobacterium sp.]|uniref:SRPBCC family protein n=1 Tax=Flavobacterium sp. TaxID=239 RepID=UPI003527DD87